MDEFKSKIRERLENHFYGTNVNVLLGRLEQTDANNLRSQFQIFYKTTLDYVEKWFKLERLPQKIDWISLRTKRVLHQDVLDLAAQICPDIDDSIFDEVSSLNKILEEIKEEHDHMSATKKWQKIFSSNLPGIYKLVSKILSIPVSSSFIERIFSLCGSQWTDERNSLEVNTVKSLVQVKTNYDLTCPEMYKMLLSNPKLLKEIMGGEKYH